MADSFSILFKLLKFDEMFALINCDANFKAGYQATQFDKLMSISGVTSFIHINAVGKTWKNYFKI